MKCHAHIDTWQCGVTGLGCGMFQTSAENYARNFNAKCLFVLQVVVVVVVVVAVVEQRQLLIKLKFILIKQASQMSHLRLNDVTADKQQGVASGSVTGCGVCVCAWKCAKEEEQSCFIVCMFCGLSTMFATQECCTHFFHMPGNMLSLSSGGSSNM